MLKITQEIAQQIGRITAGVPLYEEFKLTESGKKYEAFANLKIVSGVIYCIGGKNTDGTPQSLASRLYIGRTDAYLLDSRTTGEEDVPYVIAETAMSEKQSAKVFVLGDAGDYLVLVYRV